MSHILVEVDAFTASLTVPDPGDPVTSNDVVVAVSPLANRTKNLHEGDVTFSGGKIFGTSGHWRRHVSHLGDASPQSFGCPIFEHLRIPGALTGNMVITLLDSGVFTPPDGSFLAFKRIRLTGGGAPSAHTVTFKRETGAVTIATFNVSVDAWAYFEYLTGSSPTHNTGWNVAECNPGVTIA